MPNRTLKFALALFASFLAGVTVATIPLTSAPAAEDCLAGPDQDQTPPGGHWYYRIDHATKRHCWHLGEERDKLTQITAPQPSQSEPSVSPKAETTMQPSIADAHAELAPQTRIDAPNRDDAFAAASPAKPAIRENTGDISGAAMGPSIVASRWPDSSAADASSDPASNEPDAVASVNSAAQTPPAIPAAAQLAAADPSSQTSTYSLSMQLAAALMAALALAGVMASVIFRFGRTRHYPAQAKTRPRRAASWEATDDDSILLSAEPEADVLPRRRGFARDLDRAGDRSERIADFFAQLSGRT